MTPLSQRVLSWDIFSNSVQLVSLHLFCACCWWIYRWILSYLPVLFQKENLSLLMCFFFRIFFPYGSECRCELQMIKALLCLPEVQLRFCGVSCQVEKEFILISCFLLTWNPNILPQRRMSHHFCTSMVLCSVSILEFQSGLGLEGP